LSLDGGYEAQEGELEGSQVEHCAGEERDKAREGKLRKRTAEEKTAEADRARAREPGHLGEQLEPLPSGGLARGSSSPVRAASFSSFLLG
jgi:hypothetical protein